MSVLNKNSIQQLRSENKLVIEPFTERNLGPNSYDVTLGDQYYRLEEKQIPEDRRMDLRRKEGPDDSDFRFFVMNSFGSTAGRQSLGVLLNPYLQSSNFTFKLELASVWKEFRDKHKEQLPPEQFHSFRDDDRVIFVGPHETLLGYTQEFIGSASPKYCTLLRTRSSWARWGVSFTGSAGWGDSGFFGRWALRIVNHTPYWIPILAGSRVAQIVFLEVGYNESATPDGCYTGKYQEVGKTVEQLKADWKPEMLLPQMWKDLLITS